MNISGILVVVPPRRTDTAIERLCALPGIEVHYSDAASGRIVITQEAPSISAEVEGLKRIRALPDIILAEMSYHYFGEDADVLENISRGPDGESPSQPEVPPYLNE
jgi:nitrate reductase NapD